ncbi:bacterioferritin [Dokdonella immobilis]|uniref:Bacterioferritin n=1 Tax=Dokdonella immobilis TaxID=578942 RepID=A0A1I4VT36_9GAMM|nr:bacterioferritin [Dokdonella immobilis]
MVGILNEALATEIFSVPRYKRHFFMATGINAQGVAQVFLRHANEAQLRADQVAQHIVHSGASRTRLPKDCLLSRSHSEYVEGSGLLDMIKQNLVAERAAIHSCREMIAYLGNDNPTVRRMLEGILAMEDVHTWDRVSLWLELGR